MIPERSTGSLVMGIVAIALIVISFAVPWFSYDYSSGRRAPYGGFHPANETGVITHYLDAGPGGYDGDIDSEQPATSERIVTWTAWALYAALGFLVLAALGDIPGVDRFVRRRVGLGLIAAAVVAVGAALYLLWYDFPTSMGHGVTGPYTSYQDNTGYTMTEMRAGWVAAALAVPAIFGMFLFKFQAGAPDPGLAAEYIAKEES